MPFPVHVKTIAALRKGPIARGALSSIAIRVGALGLWFVQAVLTARLLGPGGWPVRQRPDGSSPWHVLRR